MAKQQATLSQQIGAFYSAGKFLPTEVPVVDPETLPGPGASTDKPRNENRRPERRAEKSTEDLSAKPRGPRIPDIALITMSEEAIRDAIHAFGRTALSRNRSWKQLYLTPLHDAVLTKEAYGSDDRQKHHAVGFTLIATETKGGRVLLKAGHAVGKYSDDYERFARVVISANFFLYVYERADCVTRLPDGKLGFDFSMTDDAVADELFDRNGDPLPEEVRESKKELAVRLAYDIKRTRAWLAKKNEEKARATARKEKIAAAIKDCPVTSVSVEVRSGAKKSVPEAKQEKQKPERKPRYTVPEGFDPALPRLISTGSEKDVRDRLVFDEGVGKGQLFDLKDGKESATFSYEVLFSSGGEIRVIGTEASGRFADLCEAVNVPETTFAALRNVIDGDEDGADEFALVLGREHRKVFRKEVPAKAPRSPEEVHKDQLAAGVAMTAAEALEDDATEAATGGATPQETATTTDAPSGDAAEDDGARTGDAE